MKRFSFLCSTTTMSLSVAVAPRKRIAFIDLSEETVKSWHCARILRLSLPRLRLLGCKHGSFPFACSTAVKSFDINRPRPVDRRTCFKVLLIALEALERLGLTEAALTVGHAGFILGILEGLGLSGENLQVSMEAMRSRDRERLRTVFGGEPPSVLLEVMKLFGGMEVLERAEKLAPEPGSRIALERLRTVATAFEELGQAQQVQFDLSEILGFDYYTGTIFEIHMPGAGVALGGGGRYDSLMGRFGAERPAIGFSLSLDRLAHVLSSAEAEWMRSEPPTIVNKQDGPSPTMSKVIDLRRRGRKVRIV